MTECRKDKKNKIRRLVAVAGAAILLTGCAGPGDLVQNARDRVMDLIGMENNSAVDAKTDPAEATEYTEGDFVAYAPGDYDSADTAVLVELDEAESIITFQNINSGRNYTLSYNGTTKCFDKYEKGISLSQLSQGDIVYITFLKTKKFCNSIMITPDAWSYSEVNRYTIDKPTKKFTIGDTIYNYTEDLLVVSQNKQAEIMDINSADTLTIKGIGHTIYSVTVDKGHGYLRLSNDEYFVGGWIEVGQELIQPITEGMLLVVPEGSYSVQISNQGSGGTKEVTIGRDEEVNLDIGDLEIAEKKQGSILFSVTPTSAKMVVDGTEVDLSRPVELDYGIHQMVVSADGYDTITQYIKVGSDAANINVALEQTASGENTVSANGTENESGNGTGTTATGSASTNTATGTNSKYKVYLESPEGAEVYVDGSYIGILPVNFPKVTGSHVVTLRREGYDTRSYTIQVDGEEKDINYSFADLVKTGE
ncbi:MAG: PEGA domain-containing protein [Lachnospiraceae bacterium]|nr:PEGA domain-containing protein [Lachnospiraceae bacterium]